MKPHQIFFAFTISLCFIGLSAQAQSRAGLAFRLGHSQIQSDYDYEVDDQTFAYAPSFGAAVVYEMDLGANDFIGLEFNYQLIRGNETVKFDVPDSAAIGTIKEIQYRRSLSYFGIPIYYGWRMKEWEFMAGWYTGVLINSRSSVDAISAEGSSFLVYTTEEYFNSLPIKRLDFGPRIGISRKVFDDFHFQLLYYQGLARIGHEDSNWDASNWSVNLGFSYLVPISKAYQ